MRIPISWLKEYVEVKSVKELSDKLTMSGTENEILHAEKGDFEKIVVGEILEIKKHPNADKLQITKTSVGKETLQIVCGAPNIKVGQKVPVALVGAQIGEFEIREAELRGIKSHGMLCSESELGISDDHSGIMVLDPRAKVGESLGNVLGLPEKILDAEITPNRGDCLSMIGIARETAVVTNQKLKLPQIKIQEAKEKASDFLSVEIKDKDLCRRYIGRVIKNVKVGPSPQWMQDSLSASGVRPISNIVDVTNYVMLEMGQPLHAFDAEKISGRKIIVRRAKKGEKIETLDGTVRTLNLKDLVIADDKKAIALAGVMGGANSEVTDRTKTVVLESANFHPTSVRKTALSLALRSESSARFEKGLPLQLTEEAADRAAALLAEIADGEVLAGKVDMGEKKDKETKITIMFNRIETFLGENISPSRAIEILTRLGFQVSDKTKDRAVFIVPYWRLDVSIEEDLFEEIARIYGYENIPSTLPEGVLPIYEVDKKNEVSEKTRDIFTALGFYEVLSYSFTNKEKANVLKKDNDLVKIANPLSQEQEFMRKDLLGSSLEIAAKNNDYKRGTIKKIFEISSVYTSKTELMKLSGFVFGEEAEEVFRQSKGSLEVLFNTLGVAIKLKDCKKNEAVIIADKNKAGSFMILDSTIMEKFKVKSKSACFFEIDMKILAKAVKVKKYQNIPKFPGSERDLTFIVDESLRVEDLDHAIGSLKSSILESKEAVAIYRGKGLLPDKKSVSIRFIYQADRTLTDQEVDDDQTEIIKLIKDKFGGEVRGGKG